MQSLCLLDFLAGDGQGEDNSVPSPPNVSERRFFAEAPAEGSDRREFQVYNTSRDLPANFRVNFGTCLTC